MKIVLLRPSVTIAIRTPEAWLPSFLISDVNWEKKMPPTLGSRLLFVTVPTPGPSASEK